MADTKNTPDEGAEREAVEPFRDPTPNEHYTLQGVGKGLPTPETDDDAAETARLAMLEASRAL